MRIRQEWFGFQGSGGGEAKSAHADGILSGGVGPTEARGVPVTRNPRGPGGRVAESGLGRPDPRSSWRLPGASIPRMTRPPKPLVRGRRDATTSPCLASWRCWKPTSRSACAKVQKREKRITRSPAPGGCGPGQAACETGCADGWPGSGKSFGRAGHARQESCKVPFCVLLTGQGESGDSAMGR